MSALVESDHVLAKLARGRARILQGWSRHYWARSADARAVDPESDQAVRWCVVGAVGGGDSDSAYDYLYRALPAGTRGSPEAFNDAPSTTREDVVALFDAAIELRRADLERVP